MSKKVKVSMAQKTMKDKQLIDLFNQMVGTSAPDPNVVIPKYDKLMDLATGIVGLLDNYIKFAPPVLRSEFPKGIEEMEAFVAKSREDLARFKLEERQDNSLNDEELKLVNANPETMNQLMQNLGAKYDVDQLGETYKDMKSGELVNSIIMTLRLIKESLGAEAERCKIKLELMETHHNLADKNNLSAGFIKHSLGDVLQLFSFSSLNFKELYLSPYIGKSSEKRSFYNTTLYLLYLIYDKCDKVYKLVSSPDVDVDKFSEALIANIGNIKKQIPRCDAAFRKIEESVAMLRDNFGGYYKDFITSQNPGIIVENFVLDVAKDSKANFKVTQQFKKIIAFYRKRMQGQIKDPKIKRIFDLVGKNINILEKKTSRKGGDGDSDEADDNDEFVQPKELSEAERRKISESFITPAMRQAAKTRKRNPPKRRAKKKNTRKPKNKE